MVSLFVVVRIYGISDGRVCQKLNILASGYSRAGGGYGIYESSSSRRFSSYYVGQMMNTFTQQGGRKKTTVVRRRELSMVAKKTSKRFLPNRSTSRCPVPIVLSPANFSTFANFFPPLN